MIRAALITIVAAVAVIPDASSVRERVLRSEMILAAPLEQVWALWTTEAGLTSFFARGARIEPKVDGLFEILFEPSAPPGLRGAEGLRILVFEPPQAAGVHLELSAGPAIYPSSTDRGYDRPG